MKAVVQHRYGGVEQLGVTDIDAPEAAAGEVLVRVRAAGIERGTVHLMTGLPLVGRVVLGLRRPRCAVPGRELAGVVEAVGDGVTRFAVGDEVMGVPAPVLKSGAGHGALAELTRAVEDGLVAKPAALSFVEAAAVPVSASTALQAVRDHGRVQAGQRVLVIGASGGVGSYAVQLATSYGAEVTGGERTHQARPGAGARGRRGARLHPRRADRGVRRGHRHRGQPAGPAAARAADPHRDPGRSSAARAAAAGSAGSDATCGSSCSRRSPGSGWWRCSRPRTARTWRRWSSSPRRVPTGPAVERTFALDESAKAIAHLQDGHARGKVVVVP